jgi:Ca2+-binding RTX toxin-like protein
MATVTGTEFNDFIHRAGDGQTGGGNEITGVTGGADTISGLAGNDLIFADGGADTVDGGEGNDILQGGQGADTLLGGIGNDVFRIQQVSDIDGLAETVDGGSDLDTLDFGAFNAQGSVDLTDATLIGVEQLFLVNNLVTLTTAQLGAFDLIAGSGLTERLILSNNGTANLSNAVISGIEEIRGSDGNNTVILTGVAIGQTVNGRGGNDTLTGGDGGDSLAGDDGDDQVTGADGNDSLAGGDGVDTLSGGRGDDSLNGGQGADIMTGGVGRDQFVIDQTSEIDGLAESLDGGNDIDTLNFQALDAQGAVDLTQAVITSVETLLLQGNDATLTAAQLGAFTTVTGTGLIERVILSSAGTADLTGAFVQVDEIRGSRGGDTVILTDVALGQFVDGRNGNDTLTGGDGNDTLLGGGGGDTLNGSDGNDALRGGTGADTMNGGLGNDVFQIVGVSDIDGRAEVLNGGDDVDDLNFQAFNAFGDVDLSAATLTSVERLFLQGNVATLTSAQLGAFTTIAGTGLLERIMLDNGGTADLSGATVSGIDEIRGTGGANTVILTGVAAGQFVNALGGNDTLTGGDGGDTLSGGDGNDTLSGGAGNDVLTGGFGTDTLAGGLGVDTFDFDDIADSVTGSGRDVVTDFLHGTDLVDVQGIDANSQAAGNQAFVFVGGGAFSGAAGELRFAGGNLSGDVDGDGNADFQIALGSVTVTASDLLL